MGFWDGFIQQIVGKPSGSFDPYTKEDRQMKMEATKQGMANYDKMMSTPGGAYPQQWREKLHSDSQERIKSATPQAGQSGWQADTVERANQDIDMSLYKQELDMLDKQRGYNQALLTSGQPMQQQAGEAGLLGQFGGAMAARGGNALGDQIFGNPEQDKKEKGMAGRQPQNARHGMTVGDKLGSERDL